MNYIFIIGGACTFFVLGFIAGSSYRDIKLLRDHNVQHDDWNGA